MTRKQKQVIKLVDTAWSVLAHDADEEDEGSIQQRKTLIERFSQIMCCAPIRTEPEKCPRCGCRMIAGICQNYGCEHTSRKVQHP